MFFARNFEARSLFLSLRRGLALPFPSEGLRSQTENAWAGDECIINDSKAKKAKTEQRDQIIANIKQNERTILAVMEICANLTYSKEMLLNKLDTGVRLFPNTFIKTDSGYKVVNDEGYVAIDKMKGNAVKLIDRLEFSYNNFNGIKNWDK